MVLLIPYIIILVVFTIYGLHRTLLMFECIHHRARTPEPQPEREFEELPMVTVQLPLFNEPQVVERLLRAAAAIDYPRERLEIQVLDDSMDSTTDIARAVAGELRADGVQISVLHRTDRTGYKAGALSEGLKVARGEFVAIFDADFMPSRDFLMRTIHHFTDEKIGVIQTPWAHVNRSRNWLTRVQALFLDGHFMVEQFARSRGGRWFNFNGTAGIWRLAAIEEAGGWAHDTLTEDTDLSYRAQAKGWTFRFLTEPMAPAELPPSWSAFASQQHRWSKGLIQNAIKLLPWILKSSGTPGQKLEAWFHLTAPMMYPAMLLLALMAPLALTLMPPADAAIVDVTRVAGLICLLFGTIGVGCFYVVAQVAHGRSWWRGAMYVPLMLAVGVGLSVVNSRAIIEALLGKRSAFVRTPKFADVGGDDDETTMEAATTDPASRPPLIPAGVLESFISLSMLGCIAGNMLMPRPLIGTPFLILFAVGYGLAGYCGVRSLFAKRRSRKPVDTTPSLAA